MTKKSFAVSVAGVFAMSFFVMNLYLGYHLNHSKKNAFENFTKSRAAQINTRISAGQDAIAALNASQHGFDNYKFKILEQDNPSAGQESVSRANELSVEELGFVEDVSKGVQQDIAELARVESKKLAEFGVTFKRDELSSGTELSEEYVLNSINGLKKLNKYVGISASGLMGTTKYYDLEPAQKFSSSGLNDYNSSNTISSQTKVITGVGVAMFGGFRLNKSLSIETGVGFNQYKGSGTYEYEHSYTKEIQRLEWIVTGETEEESIVHTDYVESIAKDTVETSFERSMISIPLVVNYSLDWGKVNPFVSVGASANFGISGGQFLTSSLQNKTEYFAESSGLNQLNVHLGVGVDIELTKQISARIKPSLDYGLWNQNPNFINGNANNLKLEGGLYYNF